MVQPRGGTMTTDPRIGTELAGYRIESLLGRGGMSVVYLAEQEFPKRKVALKLLAPELAEDEAFRERFIRESNAAASIDDPNIVPIYGAGEADGVLYIAMRYVEGTDLRRVLDQEGPLDPIRAVSIVTQAASALDVAHASGLVHRDVKPGNILLAARAAGSGPLDHVYVSDFGLIKRRGAEKDLTRSGQIMGSVDYIAPEQILGKPVDGRADVYSLGCVLYECLTGDVPFPGDVDMAAMWAHVHEKPPKATATRPELPPGIDDVIVKALAKSPDDRFATCEELAVAARETVGEPAPATLRRWSTRRRLMAGAVLVALVAGSFGLARLAGGSSKAITGCLVTPFPPLNDRNVNQAMYNGLSSAAASFGISQRVLVSNGDSSTWSRNIHAFVEQKCSLIVSAGGQIEDAVASAAEATPDQRFALLDPLQQHALPNLLSVVFQTDQAAFMAGYLAAGTSKNGKVATFGGLPVPTVTGFMNGFAAGILKFNQDHGTDVQLLGWDPATQQGRFVSLNSFAGFADPEKGQRITAKLIAEGADIVFPVAGGSDSGAGTAAREAGKVMLIGVDTDQFYSAPEFADLWLTSVLKGYDVAVEAVMKLVVDGSFKGGTYTATLENGGVRLAPYHDLAATVPGSLRAQLARIKAGIVDGSISVDPRDYLP